MNSIVNSKVNSKTILEMAHEAGLGDAEGWINEEYEYKKEILAFAALVADAEREAILPMLKGIDQTECEDSEGWWETSEGAAFGAGILAAIRARGNT